MFFPLVAPSAEWVGAQEPEAKGRAWWGQLRQGTMVRVGLVWCRPNKAKPDETQEQVSCLVGFTYDLKGSAPRILRAPGLSQITRVCDQWTEGIQRRILWGTTQRDPLGLDLAWNTSSKWAAVEKFQGRRRESELVVFWKPGHHHHISFLCPINVFFSLSSSEEAVRLIPSKTWLTVWMTYLQITFFCFPNSLYWVYITLQWKHRSRAPCPDLTGEQEMAVRKGSWWNHCWTSVKFFRE